MKTLVCEAPGNFVYQDSDMPSLTENHTILKIRNIGICGTDLHAFEGKQPFFNYPRILGHELAGEIAATDAAGFSVGDAVTFLPYFNCGHCIACRKGKTNCCTRMQVFGVHIDGGMSEYVSIPSDKLVHSEGLTYEQLALVEPLAIGAHAIQRAGVSAEDTVLVMGAGPIGLGVMEFARIAGARVIALDINENRLKFCEEKIRVPHCIHGLTQNVSEELATITDGDMPTVVIDATGNLKAINTGFQYISHGGKYVLVGLQGGEISFIHPEFHKREATLMSSRNAVRSDFEYVIECIKNGWIDPGNYITHRVGFDEVKTDFESWLDPATGVIKAMVSLQ
ncbi:zinc-binding alcohol dehydrogenase family protein [Dyadobacter sediminis]|uniref:Zinc-binding alcohol dehydrogenase family protein n=1 Tax=Dyadobacter sediminis TaxID=1493691 RepID=A0A5R9KC08_9BACT|nr:zinc-binding alcohol dehydrogenase family protein [Dyadobacter sediminis]TLU92237.1 zinc-binding alcohol dehydrogenase family protein [Dyadobacter sediminis]GGB96294.1 alcohol dehydrogenase [Dyadobacter sediminis]